MAAIESKMSEIHVPATIHGGTYGTAKLFQQSSAARRLMLRRRLSAIYVVLGVLYESYSQPLTILSTLPSAGVGALLALMATGTEFSLIAFLGILLLIGIVKKNAIMMVDFALEAERIWAGSVAAIAHACSLRFRPIMMTTCAAIAGALPLAHRLRRRHRDAPPAGHLHRRRLDRQSAADDLHHAGGLPVRPSLLEAAEDAATPPARDAATAAAGSRHMIGSPRCGGSLAWLAASP